MKTCILTFLLVLCLNFKNNDSPKLEDGIYHYTSYNLSYPSMKIKGENFTIYNFGHAGHGMYGWGTYKLNLKDSLILFNYDEIHGNKFYPLKNYKKTEKIVLKNGDLILENYSKDKSDSSNYKFDSLFIKCKNYLDKSFETNKQRGLLKKIKKKDF